MPGRGVVTGQKSEYGGFLDLSTLGELPTIWTPDGHHYTTPRYIQFRINRALIGTCLPHAISEAARMHPKGRIPTSGEWYQTEEFLRERNHISGKRMTIGNERTSTILDYKHGTASQSGKWFNGLLIQVPEIEGSEGERRFATDERGIIRARHIWEMALPVKDAFQYVGDMPTELDPFLDTIFGMENARKKLPDTEINVGFCGLNNLLRGYDDVKPRDEGRANVLVWGYGPFEGTAVRAVIED